MRRRARVLTPVAALIVLAVLVVAPGATAVSGSPRAYPVLPEALYRNFLGNLSAPSLAPGSSGTVSFTLSDPLPGPMTATVLTLELYAFNGFPGNATGQVPVSGPPVLTTATTSGPNATVSFGTLAPHSTTSGSVGVATSDTTPSGTFAIRTAVSFTENGSSYLLESRGWFTDAQWAYATELPNGSVTLNVSRLNVSGVIPETAMLVNSPDLEYAIVAIAVAGAAVVGIGAWVYFRRASKSKEGAR